MKSRFEETLQRFYPVAITRWKSQANGLYDKERDEYFDNPESSTSDYLHDTGLASLAMMPDKTEFSLA